MAPDADHRRDRHVRHEQERGTVPADARHRRPGRGDLPPLRGRAAPRPRHGGASLRALARCRRRHHRVRARVRGEDHPAAPVGLGRGRGDRRVRGPAARPPRPPRDRVAGDRVMNPMTVLAPLGMLGYGIPARSMERGLARDPAVLALDAGSTDPGPYYLGAGVPFVNRRAAKKDLVMILDAARARGIPVLIGSAGGGGGRPHVEWTLDLYRELCRERGYRFRTAVIDAEVDRAWLRAQVAR